MRHALAAALIVLFTLSSQPTLADGHEAPPPAPPDGTTCTVPAPLCVFVVGSLVVFSVVDWLVPLNQAEADPYRCRGQGSIIKAPSPWGTANCPPLPEGDFRK